MISVRNNLEQNIILDEVNQMILPNSTVTIESLNTGLWANSDQVIKAIANSSITIYLNDVAVVGVNNQIDVLKYGYSREVSVKELVPFATPEYRTKRDAAPSWVTCPPDTVTPIDLRITEDRYISGGELIFKNAKEGDYISACIYDADSVIPENYRAQLCEAWPVVATYIIKEFLKPTSLDGFGNTVCDTYPLNAKITQGLYLRVDYHATQEAGDRRAVVNYHLTNKL